MRERDLAPIKFRIAKLIGALLLDDDDFQACSSERTGEAQTRRARTHNDDIGFHRDSLIDSHFTDAAPAAMHERHAAGCERHPVLARVRRIHRVRLSGPMPARATGQSIPECSVTASDRLPCVSASVGAAGATLFRDVCSTLSRLRGHNSRVL
ncbi:MAG: hypothetical protein LBV73_28010 [Paraburkholderia sp.]|nr:hypothetical protein [Paraburkholderia sp.]